MAETKEHERAYIAALLREREGAVRYSRDGRLEEIDKELRRLGHKAAAPAKRAEQRPAAKSETR